MAVRVLIVTSIRSLGELMQRALGETGLYRADLVESAAAGLEHARAEAYPLAIVDFGAMPDPVDFIANMRGESSQMRILGMPAGPNDPQNDLHQSVVDAWLAMPFYLPNLLDTLASLAANRAPDDTPYQGNPQAIFTSTITPREKNPAPAPEWLQDVNRVAQHLTRLSLQSAAQAALITRGNQLWAYAGQLPQPAAEELARLVGHYWAHDGGSDLARFTRLEATNSEYMIYATSLGDDYVLALVFEAETPFTEMRTQAGSLARQLSKPPQDEANAPGVDTALEDAFATGADFAEEFPRIPSDWRPDESRIAEGRHNFFEDLLKSMDIPVAEGVTPVGISSQNLSATPPNGALYEWAPGSEAALPGAHPQPQDESVVPPPEAGALALGLETALEAPPPLSLADTRPTKTEDGARVAVDVMESAAARITFAPESPTATLHNLTYACVLVPRLPHHHLVGDLAEYLNQWTRQLSMAFGWRLEHLSVRPDYLHWIAVVPPDASPGMMVHNLRVETSQRIFKEIPRLERDNPSGEFWVADYLIVNGRDPFSRQMVQEFINNVRTRQGAQ